MINAVVPLTGARDLRAQQRLVELEGVIQGGLQSFIDVGEALLEIRGSKLYRFTDGTFEAYCHRRWGFTSRRANQLMDAAEIGTIVPIANVEQAKPLAAILRQEGPEAVREAWAETIETTNGHPTAEAIRATVVGPGATRPKWNPGGAVMSSESPNWYTPRHVLTAVVAALGSIDLDPCAEDARTVPAAQHITEAEDGLKRPWPGRVYMNPPYGRTIGDWTGKLRAEYDAGRTTEAIALLPARTETVWWEAVGGDRFCFIRGRLAFSDHETSAPFPSAAVYLGHRPEAFRAAFAPLGRVLREDVA